MNTGDSCFPGLARPRHRLGAIGAAVLLFGAGSSRGADDAPTEAMRRPVDDLVRFMSTLRPDEHPHVFVRRSLCIIENFAPFVFCGAHAAQRWETGFRAHALEENLAGLAATFGPPQDFARAGRRVYFALPTTWTGLTNGRRFEEHGAWAYVLEREAGAWKIAGYGWGVTSYSEDGISP